MDQKTPIGNDKRSWRERLGIGAGGKDLPKVSADLPPMPKSTSAIEPARSAVRPAPMAPRAPRPASATSDGLADKLKSQRDASEKLAEQRIQAARTRADVKATETTNGNGAATNGIGSKPAFSFADDMEAPLAPKPFSPPAPKSMAAPVPKPAMAPPPRPTMSPPPAKPMAGMPPLTSTSKAAPLMPPRPQPGLAPARPSLGQTPMRAPTPQSYAPLPNTGRAPTLPPPRAPQGMPYGQPQQQGYGQQAPLPPYRPVDPAQRYAPPFTPQPGRSAYAPPAPQGYAPQPRLPLPPQPAGYGDYNQAPAAYAEADPRTRGYRPPQQQGYQYGGEGDLFDDHRPAPRRASAGEYSQAYRDAEHGFDEDMPRSRGPLLLVLLLALGAAVLLGTLAYYYYNIRPQVAGQGQKPPVVEAPAQPAKAQPENAPAQPAAQTKKLIYDRIVGDQEIVGGDVLQSEEAPIAPADTQGEAPAGGEDLTPLPLPPPPGEGGDQQGSLSSPETGKSDSASITPAAGASQAAAPPSDGGLTSTKSDTETAAGEPLPLPPPPGSVEPASPGSTLAPEPASPILAPAEATTATATADDSDVVPDPDAASTSATKPDTETIADVEEEPAVPVKKKTLALDEEAAPKPKAKKTQTASRQKQKSLGSSPVVLVPAQKRTQEIEEDVQIASADDTGVAAGGGGLYDGEGLADPQQATPSAPKIEEAPKKKRRTLADLFKADDSGATTESAAATPTKKTATPAPEAEQQVASAGPSGFIVQFASFRSRDDASREYNKLSGKHAVLGPLSPIISEQTFAGSKRYRLAAGTFQSRAQASAVCQKLIAAGERDCQVRKN